MVARCKALLCSLTAAFLFTVPISAGEVEKWSIGTNAIDWAEFGTINVEAGIPLSRHWSVVLGTKINPWQFKKTDPDYIIQDRKITGYAGARYWSWMVFSGFWAEGRIQYQKFDVGGLWRPSVDSGQAVGVGLSAGYTFMLSPHINLELGAGFWAGYAFEYNLIHCGFCDTVRESGPRWFIFPENIKVAVAFVF